MIERDRRIQRVRNVYEEFLAATVALELLEEKMNSNPSYLSRKEIRGRVVRELRDHLEATYLVRLFAEFEAGLRDIWKKKWLRSTEPPIKALIQVAGSRQVVPQDWIEETQLVRDYRNDVVHEGGSNVEPVSLADSLKHLSRFFSMMPGQW
jgi:hypothetical protein